MNEKNNTQYKQLGTIDPKLLDIATDFILTQKYRWEENRRITSLLKQSFNLSGKSYVMHIEHDTAWKELQDIIQPIEDAVLSLLNGDYTIVYNGFSILEANKSYQVHIDPHLVQLLSNRIQVPLITTPDAIVNWYDIKNRIVSKTNLQRGNAYLFHNSGFHSVVNNGSTDRIHLMFDAMDTKLWNALQACGRASKDEWALTLWDMEDMAPEIKSRGLVDGFKEINI